MQILMDLPSTMLEKFSYATGHKFVSLKDTEDVSREETVACVIEGENFETSLGNTVCLGIPIVVIAGSADNCEKPVSISKVYGVPEACIVVKKDNNIVTLDNVKYGEDEHGITLQTVVKICQNAVDKKLYPVLYVWKESDRPKNEPIHVWRPDPVPPIKKEHKHKAEYKHQESQSKANPNKTDKTVSKLSRPPKASNAQVIESSLGDVLKLFENVVTVFNTVPKADSSGICQAIAKKLGALHIEINAEPSGYQAYADTLEKAVCSGEYAYCNGETVSINNLFAGSKWAVIEHHTEAMLLEAMETVYKKANKVVHVPTNYEDSNQALDAWNFRLDAIIPDHSSNISELSKHYKNVMDIQTFVNICKED